MGDKEEARRKIEELVQDYRNFAASHDEAEVNEERVKIGFIAPLLEALGWNMRADEVLPEQRTLVGEADFGLRIYGTTPQIYVECKAFRESLDGHRIERGRQVTYPEKAIQYAWSMKANWAILTNFKKLRLYYTLVRKPTEGLVFPEISFEEYISKFDLVWLISKDSLLSGAIETYRKKATRNYVDEEFLKDLLESRQLLLNSIHKNNPALSTDDLNESAQRILDRITFVRSCEDRNIIPAEMLWKHYMHWQDVAIDKTVRTFMVDLKNMFRDIDRVYNGKLFEPHICEDLKIDNSVFREILERLYGDGNRVGYRFDAIPINVLGQAYELYIGSVIKEKMGAVKSLEILEDYKKRQQHGIYYTPTFVTRFIVRWSLGEILGRTKTVDDVLKVKLLDQAAGSGSFLIEAFDRFREAYLTYKGGYEQNVKQAPLEVRLVQPEWADAEKAVLQNNIYGVDLDPQAVEITTLNLELKAVKTMGRIPYLGERIKRGNSIISHTADELLQRFTEEKLKELLGEDWRTQWEHKHPFRYSEAFKEIMQDGGFDVVVGNPPYNNMRDPELRIEQAYCERFHDDVFRGNSDILFYFIKSGLSVLKQGGLLGLIVARYFMKSEEADRLRNYILQHSKIRYIIDTRNVQMFGRVNVLTCIIVLERDDSPPETKTNHLVKVVNVKADGDRDMLFEHITARMNEETYSDKWIDVFTVRQGIFSSQPWTLEPPAADAILNKIRMGAWSLSDLADVAVGFVTGMNEAVPDEKLLELASKHLGVSGKELKVSDRKVSLIDDSKSIEIDEALKEEKKEGVFILSNSKAVELGLEKELLVPVVMPHEIQRYGFSYKGNVLIKTDRETDIDSFPRTKAHLARFKHQLEQRDAMPRCKWYGVSLLKNRELFETAQRKIMVPAYATGNRFALDDGNHFYCINTAYIIVPKNECAIDIRYMLAVLNSKLMEFYHKRVSKLKREGYYEYFAKQLRRLPIREIDLRKGKDKTIHDRIVDLVAKLIDARQRLLLLEKTFDECTALYPSNESLSRLKTYYEYDGIQPKVLGDFNRKRGTVYAFKVYKEKAKITLLIDYVPEESENQETIISGTPALDLKFKDEGLCDFIYYSLRKFIAETGKKILGRGNILKVIQTGICIPTFVTNQKENVKVIRKIMNQFQARTEGLLGKHVTLEQLEGEIQALDNEIEIEVRNLYGITKNEGNIIQTELLS